MSQRNQAWEARVNLDTGDLEYLARKINEILGKKVEINIEGLFYECYKSSQ